MLGLHKLDVLCALRNPIMQLRPQHLVFGQVVVMQRREHIRDMVGYPLSLPTLTRLYAADQQWSTIELLAENLMNQSHLECVGGHLPGEFRPTARARCQLPEPFSRA
jgi:hypothetical protein